MKTTLEIPDAVFRRAKARAAAQGIPLRQLVTEAVREKLDAPDRAAAKAWMGLAGKLKHLKKDAAAVARRIEEEFEKIEPEDRR